MGPWVTLSVGFVITGAVEALMRARGRGGGARNG